MWNFHESIFGIGDVFIGFVNILIITPQSSCSGSSLEHTLLKFNDTRLKEILFKISVKVSASFTSQLISNHTIKMAQVPTEINGNLHFSHIWHDETF